MQKTRFQNSFDEFNNIKYSIKLDDIPLNLCLDLQKVIQYIEKDIFNILENEKSINIWGNHNAIYEHKITDFTVTIHYDFKRNKYSNIQVAIDLDK